MKKLHQLLTTSSKVKLFFLSLLLIAIIGYLDHVTGYEISFSIFYLLPVALCWYCGRQLGLLLSFISAAVWLAVDYSAGQQYTQSWIPIWNALMRFAFFYFSVLALTKIKQDIIQEELLSRTDALTKLSNSRHFREQSTLLFNLANRQGQPLALAYIDLDNFKSINDNYGHETGDQVLKQVGKVLAAALRGSDIAGRLGGDEFAVLLTGTDSGGAKTFFTRLQLRLLDEMKKHGWTTVGFSIGVAIYPELLPEGTIPLQEADELMYRVKKMGKNQVLCQEFKTGHLFQRNSE